MRFDNHLLGGLVLGIIIGLKYGATLSGLMPIFVVLGVVFLLQYVKAR